MDCYRSALSHDTIQVLNTNNPHVKGNQPGFCLEVGVNKFSFSFKAHNLFHWVWMKTVSFFWKKSNFALTWLKSGWKESHVLPNVCLITFDTCQPLTLRTLSLLHCSYVTSECPVSDIILQIQGFNHATDSDSVCVPHVIMTVLFVLLRSRLRMALPTVMSWHQPRKQLLKKQLSPKEWSSLAGSRGCW